MPRHHRFFGCTLIIALTLSQTACDVTSQYPLSNPRTAAFDERLFGEWRLSVPGSDGAVTHYFIGKTTGEVVQAPKGLVVIHCVRINTKEKTIMADESPLYGFSSKVDTTDFLNLTELKKQKDQPLTWETNSYFFIKYTAEPNRLTISIMDRQAVAKEVENRKIEGKIQRGPINPFQNSPMQIQSVFLTDSTANLRSHLEKGGHRTLFNDKEKLVLDRVRQ